MADTMKTVEKTKTNRVVAKSLLSLAVVALLAGGVVAAQAASFQSKGAGRNGGDKPFGGQNLTAEQKAEREAFRTAHQAEMAAKQETVKAAMDKGDYQAWLNAVGATSTMAVKIGNAANFAKFVEAHNLRTQADAIMKSLGFDGQSGFHMGGGMGPKNR